MQVEKGTLTEAEAENHPDRNVITKSLGNPSLPEPTVSQFQLQPGDRLLLCSDGLSGVAGDAEIAAVLGRAPEPERAIKPLIDLANKKGGPDNITAVVVQVGPVPALAAAPRRAAAPIGLALVVMAAALIAVFLIFRPPGGGEGATSIPTAGGPAGTVVTSIMSDASVAPGEPTSTPGGVAAQPSDTPTATPPPTATPLSPTATPPPAPSRMPTVPPIIVGIPPGNTVPRPEIIFPVSCSEPSAFDGNERITFRWRWVGQVQGGNYLEIRIDGQSQGELSPSVQSGADGSWQWAGTLSPGEHSWQVVYMSTNPRTPLVMSEAGCFSIREAGGPGPSVPPGPISPSETPVLDRDRDGTPDNEDICPDEAAGNNTDPDRPGCPAPTPAPAPTAG
jgi:hypothetical protein